MPQLPRSYQDVDSCVDAIIQKVGKEIVLGLGKPSQLTNALYQRAKSCENCRFWTETRRKGMRTGDAILAPPCWLFDVGWA